MLLHLCSASMAWCQNFNLELLGQFPYDVELSDVWGYADEEGNEYALVGKYDGVSIVDVTDPQNMTEVYAVPGNTSIWRDLKTWNDHAYVTCECGPGLLIIDLSPLPDTTSLSYTFWTGDTFTFYRAHNLYIDENGIAYIFGSDHSKGGAILLDLNCDPMNPEVLGRYDQEYLHDGVVRGDTLWGAAMYVGDAQVIDVSDKQNPTLLSAWKTPNTFTHNLWFSDDNRYVFTTDEVKNGSIGAFDVSDIYNPTRLDVWHPNDTAIIPHNTHYFNGFLINAHYTIGVNVIDVSRPGNMIEVGRYDTSPDYTYEGFHGCWGAYPFLPSGNILAADIEEGLHVFAPNYVRGCYLEGKVTDLHTGGPVFFPTIEIVEDGLTEKGNIVGHYATAVLTAGTYTVEVSADGYFPKTITGVELVNGQLTLLNVELDNWPAGSSEIADNADFSIYPNPAREAFYIENARAGRLSLTDLNGRVLQSRYLDAGAHTLDWAAHLGPGVYFLKLEEKEGALVRKLLVD